MRAFSYLTAESPTNILRRSPTRLPKPVDRLPQLRLNLFQGGGLEILADHLTIGGTGIANGGKGVEE